ncbi:MAG TPA: CsbD family protein [Ilumatobacter sp.]|nr:CsbD family protein [Ilumatobacter sp.]
MSDGTFDQAKGRVKQAAGALTDDDDLKREGKADETAGKVKEKLGDVKDKLEDVVDDVRRKGDD